MEMDPFVFLASPILILSLLAVPFGFYFALKERRENRERSTQEQKRSA